MVVKICGLKVICGPKQKIKYKREDRNTFTISEIPKKWLVFKKLIKKINK